MNIRFLCVFIFLMCALAAGIADAHTLHVGNKTFALSQTKYTTPSLAFGVGNEVWYAPLAPIFINESLHFRYKNIPFSVDVPDDYPDLLTEYNCPQIFTDTENYTYDENGRLIGADENLYLYNQDANQYINTNISPNQDTNVTLIFKLENGDCNIFGARNTNQTVQYMFQCANYGGPYRGQYNTLPSGNTVAVPYGNENCPISAKTIFEQNKNVATLTYNNNSFSYTYRYTNFAIATPIYLYAVNKQGQFPIRCGGKLSVYNMKIYDNNILVRHFVPVPACMRIGDFVVPENGMWDIVEQKFYGNSGTGSFIYGKDE